MWEDASNCSPLSYMALQLGRIVHKDFLQASRYLKVVVPERTGFSPLVKIFHDDIFTFSNEKLIHRELFFLSQSKNESQMHTCVHAKSLQSYMTLCNLTAVAARLLCPWDSPGKNTWVAAILSSRGSSQPRNQTWVCIVGGFFTTEPLGKPQKSNIP